MRLTDVAWLAWNVCKRTGKTTDPFDPTWIQSIDEVTVKDEQGENPLDTGQPTG
jgi:hypothetical protein